MNKWIFGACDNEQARCRLFCIPYAGAGASVYSGLKRHICEDIAVCPIQLPGRENRRNEGLSDSSSELVSAIAEGISKKLDKPFALFGHSMGGMLAYELALRLEEYYDKTPMILFTSASSVFRDNSEKKVSELSGEELKSYLLSLGGVTEDFISSSELCSLYLPIIRNDYRLVENYDCSLRKLSCSICAFASREDKETKFKNVLSMKYLTENFDLIEMSGGHFFINDNAEMMGRIISERIHEML